MKMSLILLAWRNLLRKKRQSLLIGFAVFVSSFLVLSQIAQRRGVETKIRSVLVNSLAGDLQIRKTSETDADILKAQFDELPLFRLSDSLASELNNLEQIESWDARIRHLGIVSVKEKAAGLIVTAASDGQFQRLASTLELVSGYIQPTAPNQILISQTMAEYLQVSTGDTLVMLAHNRDGYLSDDLYIVHGVFYSRGIAMFLTPIAYARLEDAQRLLNLEENEIMELAIVLRNHAGVDQARFVIQNVIARTHHALTVESWNDTAPLFKSIITIWKGGGIITFSILCSLIFVLMSNIVIMAIHNRRKETGTLLAIGFLPKQIVALFGLEIALLTIVACGAGCFIVVPIVSILSDFGIPTVGEAMEAAYAGTRFYPMLSWYDPFVVLVIFTCFSMAASIIPALKGVRLSPAVLLRTTT